jgi:hypothetical protein
MAITELFIKLLETEAPISRRVLEQCPRASRTGSLTRSRCLWGT